VSDAANGATHSVFGRILAGFVGEPSINKLANFSAADPRLRPCLSAHLELL
jgi:hypothetical protein